MIEFDSSFARYSLRLLAMAFLCLLSRPVQAITFDPTLTPRDCAVAGCVHPVADGNLLPQEYSDGWRAPLSDFEAGRRTGTIQFALDGRALFVGVQVEGSPDTCFPIEFPDSAAQLHEFDLAIDTQSCGPAGSTARKLHIEYDTLTAQAGVSTGRTTVSQFMGNEGAWITPPPGQEWNIQVATHLDVTGGARNFTIELRIELPDVPGATTFPLMKVGASFSSECHGGLYEYPASGLSFASSCWWQRIEFRHPTPVSLDIVDYNVGQMPTPIADQGTGEAMQFGFIASEAEHICLEEAWTHGDRDDIYATANLLRAMVGKQPMHAVGLAPRRGAAGVLGEVAGTSTQVLKLAYLKSGSIANETSTVTVFGSAESLGEAFSLTSAGEDTGLLFMSSRPISKALVQPYPYDMCEAEDCLEDKGFIYARILLDSAEAEPDGIEFPSEGLFDGDEFVDFFCTHLQNDTVDYGDRGRAEAMRDAQAAFLNDAVNVLAANDRPTLVAGDFNVNANDPAAIQKLYRTFGIDHLTTLDTLSVTHSDRYDLGMFEPFTTVDIATAGHSSPLGVPGYGTSLEKDCWTSDPAQKKRLDLLFALPPRGLSGIPTLAVEAGSFAFPVPFFPGNTLDVNNLNSPRRAPGGTPLLFNQPERYPLGGPPTQEGQCLSDHAALFGSVKLARTIAPGSYNPKRPHRISFELGRLEGLDDDGCIFCGAPDWYGDVSGTLVTDNSSVLTESDLGSQHFGTFDGEMNAETQASLAWFDAGLRANQITLAHVNVSVFDDDNPPSADDEAGIDLLTDPSGPTYDIIQGKAIVRGYETRTRCDLAKIGGPHQRCIWTTFGLTAPRARPVFTMEALEL